MENCIFCRIINKEIPAYRIYENGDVLAFLDIAKDAIGHTLVIPKKHYVNILDADLETLNKVTEVVKIISKHYVENCGFTGVNILNANEKSASQSVFHLHFHIIPRKEFDGLDTWLKLETQQMDLNEIWEKLKIK